MALNEALGRGTRDRVSVSRLYLSQYKKCNCFADIENQDEKWVSDTVGEYNYKDLAAFLTVKDVAFDIDSSRRSHNLFQNDAMELL
jgi:hypothetical protein